MCWRLNLESMAASGLFWVFSVLEDFEALEILIPRPPKECFLVALTKTSKHSDLGLLVDALSSCLPLCCCKAYFFGVLPTPIAHRCAEKPRSRCACHHRAPQCWSCPNPRGEKRPLAELEQKGLVGWGKRLPVVCWFLLDVCWFLLVFVGFCWFLLGFVGFCWF